MNKLNPQKFKLTIGVVLMLVFTVGLTGCDSLDEVRPYSINIEIAGLEEDARDNLSISYNGEILDQLTYDENEDIFKATISGLRGSNEIKPVYSGKDFYNVESKSGSLEVSFNDNDKTIKFYANKTRTVEDINRALSDSNPGDTLEVIADISEDADINITGLNIIGIAENKRLVEGSNITISADDITLENFKFTDNSKLILDGSDKLQIQNNDFENNSDLAVFAENSEATFKGNSFSSNYNGISIIDNSNIDLNQNEFRDNIQSAITISNSTAKIDNKNKFINNETAIDGNDSSVEITNENEFRGNEDAIKIINGNKTIIKDNSPMNNNTTAIYLDGGEAAEINGNTIGNNSSAIKVKANNASIKNNTIDNNTNAMIVQGNSDLYLSQNDIYYNEVGLLLDSASAEIEFNTFESSGDDNSIKIYGEEFVSDTLINNNNFLSYKERAIVAKIDESETEDTDTKLDATQNYWDTVDESKIEELLEGKINFKPFSQDKININN